jgi:3-phosphoshikimate 1-carboxyvinyltransferase
MRALGVKIERRDPTTLVVHGVKKQFTAPGSDIDCGNSGSTMRILSGILAAQPFRSRLVGDESLSQRPMKRIIEPLSKMGTKITAEGGRDRAPLVIQGARPRAITYSMPIASAQVKSAILFAGMYAKGTTSVIEPFRTRDHTERMLRYFLVRPQRSDLKVSIIGGQTPESRNFTVPGDLSSAAFWMAAAAAHPASNLLVDNVGLNKTRTGILSVLLRMGARVREVVKVTDEGEPRGSIRIDVAMLRATDIRGKEIPNVIDEIPILAVIAALAEGTTTIADAGELRRKETDRLSAIAANLKGMGAKVTEQEDGLVIVGGSQLRGARLQSFGDHRIAMAFAIAGLFAHGETIIDNIGCVETSYPNFHETLLDIQKATLEPQTFVAGSMPHDER